MGLPEKPSGLQRLGRRASGFLRRQISISNLRAAAKSTKIIEATKTKRVKRRLTLKCIQESPESSPEPPNNRLSVANQTQQLQQANSAFNFLGQVKWEDGSSIADYDSITDEDRAIVKRSSTKCMANDTLNSCDGGASNHSNISTESYRDLEINGYIVPTPHQRDLERVEANRNLYAKIDLGLEDYPHRAFGRRSPANYIPPHEKIRYRHQFIHSDVAGSRKEKDHEQDPSTAYQYSAGASFADKIGFPHARGLQTNTEANFKTSGTKLSAYNPGAWDEEFEEILEAEKGNKEQTNEGQLSAYNPGAWDDDFDEGVQANETFYPPQNESDAVGLRVALTLANARIAGLEGEARTLRLQREESVLKIDQLQDRTEYLFGGSLQLEAQNQYWQQQSQHWQQENQRLREEMQAWEDQDAEENDE